MQNIEGTIAEYRTSYGLLAGRIAQLERKIAGAEAGGEAARLHRQRMELEHMMGDISRALYLLCEYQQQVGRHALTERDAAKGARGPVAAA
jgi:hypothetical protein